MVEKQELIAEILGVQLELLRCFFNILPAVHWSLPTLATDSLLSEFALNGLMLAEAYTALYYSLLWYMIWTKQERNSNRLKD